MQVSGPGLTSATVNHPTHVLVQPSDYSPTRYSNTAKVTARLEPVSETAPTTPSRINLQVAMTSPSQYEVSYTPVSRGQHKLHVQVNDREINGSPFTVTVYPDPRQLGHPVSVYTSLSGPYGMTFNKDNDIIVTESNGDTLSIIDAQRRNVRKFHGAISDSPKGVAIDGAGNIYVTSKNKLQKFSATGALIKRIGRTGRSEGEFADPRAVTVHNDQLYVCDIYNHRIQVFDLDLNFVRSIGSHGEGREEFDEPQDVWFDTAGNMYVAEWGNGRIQVLDGNCKFKHEFGREGSRPSGLTIADRYVYVSDLSGHYIAIYDTSGQFVAAFGRDGTKEGEFQGLRVINTCVDVFIHVCDSGNNRIQSF